MVVLVSTSDLSLVSKKIVNAEYRIIERTRLHSTEEVSVLMTLEDYAKAKRGQDVPVAIPMFTEFK